MKITRAPSGHRCGQSHQKAELTDEQVRTMRAKYVPFVTGYGALGKEFGCSPWTARDIVTYRTRVNA